MRSPSFSQTQALRATFVKSALQLCTMRAVDGIRLQNSRMTSAAPHLLETVLIVDDDPDIRQLLRQYLEVAGMRPLLAADASEARTTLQQHLVDLVLLDVMLPNESGLDFLRWLREHTRVPVIMVTALGSTIDRVVGLEVGADDYVSKPFEPGELVARIRAVLRWAPAPHTGAGAPPAPIQPVAFRFGAWRLDTASRELRHADGVLVPLSTSEYRLLTVFLTHPRTVMSRERLVELAHRRELQPTDRSMDIQIHRLRQRLRDASDGQLFRTVRNIGYALDADVETVSADA